MAIFSLPRHPQSTGHVLQQSQPQCPGLGQCNQRHASLSKSLGRSVAIKRRRSSPGVNMCAPGAAPSLKSVAWHACSPWQFEGALGRPCACTLVAFADHTCLHPVPAETVTCCASAAADTVRQQAMRPSRIASGFLRPSDAYASFTEAIAHDALGRQLIGKLYSESEALCYSLDVLI